MNNIKVHVLNFHGPFTHIEILLQDTATNKYYLINRWHDSPQAGWSGHPSFKKYLSEASSVYSFDIKEDPDKIQQEWTEYWNSTEATASIIGNNCAVAAQWFLHRFANIPEPSLSNISWNHLALGILWPSFIPCPVTLPGRIMSNVKFHINARTNKEIATKYSYLFLYTSLSLSVLLFGSSLFALSLAATILSGGIASLAIVGCVALALASGKAFFKAYNEISAKNIALSGKKPEPGVEAEIDLVKSFF